MVETLFNWKEKRLGQADDVTALQRLLTGRGWTKKGALGVLLGWPERRLQNAKEAAAGAIISSSQRGYCLADEATRAEALAALNEQRDRIRTMSKNYVAELKRFHSHELTPV